MVKIEKNDNGKLLAYSPYNPDLPSAAKKLGGRWNATEKAWTFDVRDEARVRELYRSIYGTDGTQAAGDLVTLKVRCVEEWDEWRGGLFVCGRQVARATGRDSGAKLAEGVVILQGAVRSGGSVKNWRTIADDGTVFEIRDVPRPAAEQDTPSEVVVEVVEQDSSFDALREEREQLMQRVAEIDAMLTGENKNR